jgi:hypothetical protein
MGIYETIRAKAGLFRGRRPTRWGGKSSPKWTPPAFRPGSSAHNRVTGIPGDNPQQSYLESKRTLVVGVKRDLRLDTCKPSADFEFSLGTSCPGGCQYCHLQTHLGKKPYVRVYVNVDEVLAKIAAITAENAPKITPFEAASTSDPLARGAPHRFVRISGDRIRQIKRKYSRTAGPFFLRGPDRILHLKENSPSGDGPGSVLLDLVA